MFGGYQWCPRNGSQPSLRHNMDVSVLYNDVQKTMKLLILDMKDDVMW